MRAYEVVQERQITNEVLPIAAFAIGGIAMTQILTAIGAFLTAMSLVDLYKLISEISDDPEDATDDQWSDIFLSVLFLAFPALAKYGKPYFLKLIPTSWKQKAGKYVKDLVLKRLRANRASANAKYGSAAQANAPTAAARQALKAKHAAAMKAARQRANKSLKKISSNAIFKVIAKSFGASIIIGFATTYWEKMSQIEEDWAAYQKGDRETETFGDMEPAAAEKHAYDLKKKIWGELAIGVGAAVASMPTAKLVELFGGLFGRLAGGGLVGGVIKLSANAVAAAIKLGGPGIAMFMQTETGKKLLETTIVSAIVDVAGSVAINTVQWAQPIIDAAAKAIGVDLGMSTGSAIKKPAFKDLDPWGIALTTDPSNPKVKLIGGKLVTDPATGFLSPNIPEVIQDIRRTARAAGQPDPTASIPKDPAAKYIDLPV